MKRSYQVIIPIILAVIISSCSSNSNEEKLDFVKIKADEEASDTFYITSKTKIIPLETSDQSLIGELNKVIQYENEYYITERFGRDIKVFDQNGQFKRKLSKLGKGPGEYTMINGFCISNHKIYMLTNLGKINVYDTKSLEFLNNFSKPKEITEITDIFVDSVHFYLINNFSKVGEKIVHVFNQTNDQLVETGQFVHKSIMNKSEIGAYVVANAFAIQPTYPSFGFIFNQSFDNTLYEFKDGEILNQYRIDFGKYSIPKDKLNVSFETMKKYMDQNEEVRHIRNFIKRGDSFIIEIKDGDFRITGHLFYNHKTKQGKFYSAMFLPGFNINVSILGNGKNGLLSVLSTDDIIAQLDTINAKVKSNKILSEKEKQFLTIFNENSNPALIIFDL